MSWFSKPVEYRRYADGSVEIIERRSLLKIGLVTASLIAVSLTGAFVLPKALSSGSDSPLGPPPAKLMLDLVRNGDRETVYQVLTQYERLEHIGRTDFWSAVFLLDMTDLIPFAEYQRRRETNPHVIQAIDTTLDALQKSRGSDGR